MSLAIDTEQDLYKRITGSFTRHPSQLNKVNEADAEIIRLPGGEGVMAVTTDMICEEIEYGIYRDPYLMGWMTIAVNISDLCAVGAKPLYIMLNEIFLHQSTEDFISRVQSGIADACKAFNVFVLGGDTNFSDKMMLGATAIGFIQKGVSPVSRMGCREGDAIFSAGQLGMGNFLGMCRLKNIDFDFKPYPKTAYCEILGRYASACIDTSDGMLNALHLLTTLNHVGAALNMSVPDVIPTKIAATCAKMNVPPFALLAGILGEYELLFTIPQEKLSRFNEEINQRGLLVYNLGRITPGTAVSYCSGNGVQIIDTYKIAGLFAESNGNFTAYMNSLQELFN